MTFSKVLRKENPADLYTKYLDEAITIKHSTRLAYRFSDGRAAEAPKLHLLQQSEYGIHQDVAATSEAMNGNSSATRYSKQCLRGGNLKVLSWSRKNRSPSSNESCECRCDGNDLTGSGQQVLQGTNWQVQGYNGLTAAQPSQP